MRRELRRVVLDSHALQQEHYGVQLLPGSVVRSQRHDEVVEAVPGAFSRHDDQLVLESVRASVLVGHVLARLGHKEIKRTWREKLIVYILTLLKVFQHYKLYIILLIHILLHVT